MDDDELKKFLEQKFTELREYTDERTHDMETKLLKAFSQLGRPCRSENECTEGDD
jgi:hypothetical protein